MDGRPITKTGVLNLLPRLAPVRRGSNPAYCWLPLRRGAAAAGAALGVSWLGTEFHATVVSGNSMEPTFRSGQVVWLDRAAYREAPPRRGEVIVFRRGATTYVKRVYRGPGERVHFVQDQDGTYLLVRPAPIYDSRPREPYLPPGARFRMAEVGRDVVWVVGDNPRESEDSRDYGPVPLASVLGRVRAARQVFRLRDSEVPFPRRRSFRPRNPSGRELGGGPGPPGRAAGHRTGRKRDRTA